MLRGCWLLTDLDGTLVPTPHKAHGQYTTLDHSPCFGALKRWMHHGGNICVITTADRRAIDQVYKPMLSTLRDVAPHTDVDTGNLLLSPFSGAVLYRCTPRGVFEVPNYCRYAEITDQPDSWRGTGTGRQSSTVSESPNSNATAAEQSAEGATKELPADAPQYHHTCMDAATYIDLVKTIEDVFLQYAEDVIRGISAPSLGHLSRRYQHMWKRLRHHLEMRYQHHQERRNKEAEDRMAGRTLREESKIRNTDFSELDKYLKDPQEWKVRYLRNRRQLIRRLGIVRVEVLSAPNECVDEHRQKKIKTVDEIESKHREKLAADRQKRGNSKPVLRSVGGEYAETVDDGDNESDEHMLMNIIKRTPTDIVNQNSMSVGGGKEGIRVAQVIIVGMPMCEYDRYFSQHHDHFINDLKVHPIAQPNSVVFSKVGVSKGTCVAYLDNGEARRHTFKTEEAKALYKLRRDRKEGAVGAAATGGSPNTVAGFFRGAHLKRCIGLGDNPASADHALTLFPELTFVSLEVPSQYSNPKWNRNAAGVLPMGAHVTKSELQGDVLVKRYDHDLVRNYANHMVHVGNEELGCSAFLDRLMDGMSESHQMSHGYGSENLPQGETSEPIMLPLVDPSIFQNCVREAAVAAKATHLAASHELSHL